MWGNFQNLKGTKAFLSKGDGRDVGYRTIEEQEYMHLCVLPDTHTELENAE